MRLMGTLRKYNPKLNCLHLIVAQILSDTYVTVTKLVRFGRKSHEFSDAEVSCNKVCLATNNCHMMLLKQKGCHCILKLQTLNPRYKSS